jgi:hypothetical protein
MRLGLAVGGAMALAASAAFAESAIDIDRSVYVERSDDGVRALEPATTTLKKGDKVVLVLAWRASAPGRGFTVESAVPRPLAFQRAGSDAVEVSIDNGRSWGRLGDLRVGGRLASAEDVTRLRLRVPGSAPAGRMTYSAIVR